MHFENARAAVNLSRPVEMQVVEQNTSMEVLNITVNIGKTMGK